MGLFLGERGVSRMHTSGAPHRQRLEEVNARSLRSFARHVARYPGYVYQPLVAGEQGSTAQGTRIPQIQVYVSPTYNGLEFLASPSSGPRRIAYLENRPQSNEATGKATGVGQDFPYTVGAPEPSQEGRDVAAYKTFLARGSQLQAELAKLVPDAHVSIIHRFGSPDALDKAASEHPDITAWEEPKPRRRSSPKRIKE